MDRFDRAGRPAAYGAALVMAPYTVIKVCWVVGAIAGLLPIGAGFSLAGWVVLNTTTIGMAGLGIGMALALVRPWGMRVKGPLVAFVAWVGSGFLVAMLPYVALDSLLGGGSGGNSGGSQEAGNQGASMPGWEAALIQTSFVGMGLGLVVALPAYGRRRWPDAFAGRVGDGRAGDPRRVLWAAGAGTVIGLVWLYWAIGGPAGIAHPAAREINWRLLNGVCGLWAVTAAAATWVIGRRRPARLSRWVPLTVGWLGTGSLFAWSGWRLAITLYLATARPSGATLPENLAVAALLHAGAVAAGAVMVSALVRTRKPAAGAATP
ncbi:hypothetical protein P3T35_002575 [Kitasatospora sp. GP30]|uniref:hypothetical protein n=1 Tax=Kitasatospora sp. GP30 TaxID=3035084 RepID=UPI000C713528|nr:hypothetical protein [Kitasatospora sp. GP30]MDH6140567.1 hypothetical protein [Kitasatospora sp. GP30]